MYPQLLDRLAEGLCEKWHIVTGEELAHDAARASLSFCDMRFGDLASNIALTHAHTVERPARDLAAQLADALPHLDMISTCEVAGPGFVNLRFSDEVWVQLVEALREDYFITRDGASQRVNIEFISANPTGPLVLVNAWGGFYGDVLARIFSSQGYNVTREYYLNDGGNQIAQLGRAVQQSAGKDFSEEVAAELYRGQYIDELAAQLTEALGGRNELLVADPMLIGEQAKDIIFERLIQPTLQRLGIQHDEIFSERQLDNGRTIERLDKVGAVRRYDGAIWLSGEVAGLEKDEVLVRSGDGGDTYFLKDISYQLDKLERRGFDTAITIVGPDHHGQEQRLVAALHLLGQDSFVPLWTQTVRLTKDGREFKMSKRRGNYIILDEFLDSVPVDTARFFFALRDTNSHFDLDLDVISSQNKHNPLYYVLYSYVRAASVLHKADGVPEVGMRLVEKSQRQIVRNFLKVFEALKGVTSSYQVHTVLYDLIEVARSFHDWYERNPILTETEPRIRAERLAFVLRYKQAIGGLLEMIGITPIEKM